MFSFNIKLHIQVNSKIVSCIHDCSFFIDGFNVLNVPDPLIDENEDWEGFFDFGSPWEDNDFNPWDPSNEPLMVPFDNQVL